MNNSKSNPWKKNNPLTKNKNATLNQQNSVGESKFKESQKKLQNSVEKHLKNYESSSSEDENEVESLNIIKVALKKYTDSGGTNDQLFKTQTFIEESFLSGANTCLICISKIRRDDQIWNCINCYGAFHLTCIQRWSKDTIVQLKRQQQQQFDQQMTLLKEKKTDWCCPKCRHEYQPEEIPTKYVCFCGKVENPKYQTLLVPHSCGEICRKNLIPFCGHNCLLLCHPGPCPPCPITISVQCYCGSQPPIARRCHSKGWSCEKRCGKQLACGKHRCSEPCHLGECKPCAKKSIQKCLCGSQQKLRDCACPIWQCDKICQKPLSCGKHNCDVICHSGDCSQCPLTKPRTCPCGKTKFTLPCTETTPTCPDTCGKVLNCGIHTCNFRCHKDKCGMCLEIVQKSCRCGLHMKEIQCSKQYLCESKCKRMKDCNRHPCNRKCCDGDCSPCEKPCGRTLQCGIHKCLSACHRGPCFPCQQTSVVSCHCGSTKIMVPCGRKHRTKPPKCNKLCSIPPDCHHSKRDKHNCHFGDCPACKQICNKLLVQCKHTCKRTCHSAVMVAVEVEKPSMPWEQRAPSFEKRSLPCPDCKVPVMVTCLGGHETVSWPCHMAKPTSCGRPCGRTLKCTNHTCTLMCHPVTNQQQLELADDNCMKCENGCLKRRPDGCTHACPLPCHIGDCPPCKQMLRIKCYCGLAQPYICCSDWLSIEKREILQSCGNQCPKNYPCGHRCKSNCHSGACPNADQCKKKMKIACKCKRLKKEFQCETIRKGLATVECDSACRAKQEIEKIKREQEENERRKLQALKDEKDMENYMKKYSGKRKRGRKYIEENDSEEESFWKNKWMIVVSIGVIFISIFAGYQLIN